MTERIKRFGSILLVLAMILSMAGFGNVPVRAEDTATQTSLVYEVENYYSGGISEGQAADMQPGEKIEIALNTNADFAAGKYTLSINSCGNRTSLEILVNGESVGTISRTGTGFGMDQMTADKLDVTLELKPEDVVTIVAPAEGYGWVDYLRLDEVIEEEPVLPAGLVYEVENYYSGGISEGQAADMQPGEKIEIALNTNADFAAGKYTLSINSCGNRTSLEILVNGESVGTISRTGTGFGMDQMTADKLDVTLELKPEDVVTIVAPAEGYGWVDYLRLDEVIEEEPVLPAGLVYEVENYYSGGISEGQAADMQPGEKIEIALNTNVDFTAGKYTLSINSCGNRTSLEILVNGESVGTISRTGTGFGMDQMTADKLDVTLELKPEDVVTIVAPAEGYGWVDYLRLDKVIEEEPDEPVIPSVPDGATETGNGYFVYQTEYYYSGNISEGVAADMQPGEKIEIALNTNADFAAGKYTLSINSCGNRTSLEILVNGESVGTISRTGTGFGMDQMTADKLDVTLELKPEDVVTIVAPAEGYGWVDYLRLDKVIEEEPDEPVIPSVPDGATETGNGYFVYQAEYYYSGNISEGVAADMQPGETISFPLITNTDFTAGTYTLTVYSCGNRETFTVLVNGQSVGTISRTGTGFGQDQMTYDKLMSTTLSLQPGDTLAIAAPVGSYWGWVDFILLDKGDTRNNSSNNNNNNQTPATSNPTETGDGYFIYQAEAIYTKIPNTGDPAADLQPGESIDFKLSANKDFTAGIYTLSIRSCGNREQFTVKLNGEVVDVVSRTGTEFGMDQMTYDKLMVPLELKPEDTLTITAQGGSYWGWVDFIVLDVGDTTSEGKPEGEATEAGEDYYLYQAEFFYNKVSEGVAADLQPGTVINIPLNACEGFKAGWYTITVASCGTRETIYLRVNDKSIGSIARLESGYGMDEMSEDRYKVKVELGPDDVLTLSAPNDGTYGWVDYVRLNAVEPPAGAKDDAAEPTEATQTLPAESVEDSAEKADNTLPVVIVVVVLILIGCGVVAAVLGKKKKD